METRLQDREAAVAAPAPHDGEPAGGHQGEW